MSSFLCCLKIPAQHFPNHFNAKALKSKYDWLKKTYRSLNVLADWTGGGGDPDLERCLHLAQTSRTSKINVKGLTPKVIADWTVEMPWLYELFNARYVAFFLTMLSFLLLIGHVRTHLLVTKLHITLEPYQNRQWALAVNTPTMRCRIFPLCSCLRHDCQHLCSLACQD
jgi:hypothetical protein